MTMASATPTHHDALTLDIHTLTLLLQRNYHQHHRCIYYRRLSMVLSSLQRLPSFEQVHFEWMGGYKRLVQLLLDECNNEDTDSMDCVAFQRKRRAKEEHWTLKKRGDNDEKILTHEQHDDEATNKEHHLQQLQLQQLPSILHQLKTAATQTIPQTISRILHATPPILHEISRGYFAPFLTVALACLGRIHTLLLRMGRDVVGTLQESVPQLQKLIADDSNTTMKKSVMKVVGKDTMDWKMLNELITPGTFCVQSDPKQNTGLASQEWNRLLNHFVETSQDEITKQMNEFVKEKRWSDALTRFGIGNTTTSSSAEDDMSGPAEMMLTESALGGDNGDDAAEQSLLEKRGEESNRDELSSSLDMGELVNDTHQSPGPGAAKTSSSLENAVDDNMARIIQREKTKRQNTASASSMAVKSTAPKKKRKKKKKSVGAAISNDGNQEESNKATEAVPTANLIVGKEDKSSATIGRVEEGISTNPKKMPKAVQPSSGDVKSDSSAVTKQRSDSASAPLKEPKKTKKKSSKKSKKQKRKSSSNAIDDIFGL